MKCSPCDFQPYDFGQEGGLVPLARGVARARIFLTDLNMNFTQMASSMYSIPLPDFQAGHLGLVCLEY